MAGLFETLSDFFINLFSNDPNAVRLRKALREHQDTVLSVRPLVYAKNTNQVLPAFAVSWMQFYTLLLPLFDLFAKTIGSTDKKIQALSLQYLIESALVGDVATRRAAFTFDAIKQRLAASTSVDNEIAAINSDFNALLNDIRRQDGEATNKDIAELFKLKTIVMHNFQSFFKKFGYDLAHFGKLPPKFSPVDAEAILPELMDLYFIIADFDVNPSLEKGLSALLEKVSPNKASENLKKMEKILDKVRGLQRGACSHYLTLTLIRVLKTDPEFEPETMRLKDNYFHDYIERLLERFAQDRERAEREMSESSIETDIRVLFPDGHLLSTVAYNEETSKELTDSGLPGLSLVKPLRILKSFAFSVLKTSYLENVKQIVLNGFFQDKEWATKLSNSLYACENISTRIEAYDNNLQLEGKTTLTALEKYLSGKAPINSVPNQIVEKINRQASELLEKEVNEIATISVRVQEILMDYKSPQPQNITNIKGIGGKNHREIIQGLVDGYNKSMQLLRIMKHFVVIKGVSLK